MWFCGIPLVMLLVYLSTALAARRGYLKPKDDDLVGLYMIFALVWPITLIVVPAVFLLQVLVEVLMGTWRWIARRPDGPTVEKKFY